MEEDVFGMTDEELNGVMEYEFRRLIDSEILKYGFKVEVKDRNFTHWDVEMTAPEDSDYKGAKYKLTFDFFKDYPLKNPKIKFVTDIYHCNVDDNKELKVNWMMKGMKIDYIMPRLLTLFYLQDTSVDKDSEKCKLYEENKDKFKENIQKSVDENRALWNK